MSASSLIAKFGKTVTVTRYGAGAYVSGDYVPGATTTFPAVMSIQPLAGKELLNLPEAQRTRQFVRGYTATQLYTAEQSGSSKADLVADAFATYEVQRVERWESEANTIVPHWKVLMAEVNP